MATIPELLDGHVTLEVECIDRLYLNGYVPKLATGPQLSMFMRFQLGEPVPSPAVLGQVSEKFREAVKTLGARRHTHSPVQPQGTEGRHRQQLPQAAASARWQCLHRDRSRKGPDLQRKKGERTV
jgi:hypothetical protein